MEKAELSQSRAIQVGAVALAAAAGAKLAQQILGNRDLAGLLSNIGGALIGGVLGHALILEVRKDDRHPNG